jgi:hypothetical protein
MGTYAALSGNTVSNVIIADSIENAQAASGSTCVEYTQDNPAGIGWTWDGQTFSPPQAEQG